MERTALLSRCTGEKLVKNVERPLVLGLSNGTALLQQVSLNIRPSNVPTRVKVDANEFTLHKNKSNKNQKNKNKNDVRSQSGFRKPTKNAAVLFT